MKIISFTYKIEAIAPPNVKLIFQLVSLGIDFEKNRISSNVTGRKYFAKAEVKLILDFVLLFCFHTPSEYPFVTQKGFF